MDTIKKLAQTLLGGSTTNNKKKFLQLSDFYGIFSGRGSSVKVNYDAYKKSLYVYACVSKIAEKTASIDYRLYQITNSKGETKEVTTHELLDLLYKPNKGQTRAEFEESLVINMLLGGEGFIYKVKPEGSKKKAEYLKPLRPDYITIIKDKEDNIVAYEFSPDGVKKTIIQRQEMVHIKFYNPFDEARGFSPITPAKSRIETEDYATGYQRDFFERDAQPKAIIKLGANQVSKEEKDRIRTDFESRYNGAHSESNVAILEGGMEYERVSLGQKEMDYIESLKFTRDDILVAFKVPKPIVAITDDVNLANAKTAMQIFLSETIVPLKKRIIEKINEELVYTDFDPRLFLSFDDPTPQNKEIKLLEYKNGLEQGWLLPNEVRALEGLPPMVSGWTRYIPLNMVAVGGMPEQNGTKSAEGDQELAAYYEKKAKLVTASKNAENLRGRAFVQELYEFVDGFKKEMRDKTMMHIKAKNITIETEKEKEAGSKLGTYSEYSRLKSEDERNEYYKAMNTIIDNRSLAFKNVLIDYFGELEGRVVREIENQKAFSSKSIENPINIAKEQRIVAEISFPFVEEFVKQAGDDTLQSLAPQTVFEIDAETQKKIDDRVKLLAESVTATNAEKIMTVINEGIAQGLGKQAIGAKIKELFDEMTPYRAELIARTETTYANNLGLTKGYQRTGVTHKEWIATMDDRTRPAHQALNGEVVAVDAAFSNGLEFPGEPNCRCVVAPAFKERK